MNVESSEGRTEDSPKACYHATDEEKAIALHKGRQEGKEAVYGHTDKQTLSPTHFVRHAPPKESPHHHPQVHNATYSIGKRVRNKRE